ncbi:hypothetical protein CDAR_231781 [Caerostris darwini]|uniref:C2H2-type domain-containing protein n=1 Tax=Caerostris darwini TaxID=1538125 RepID=A0AAV4TYI7_9ARAC|nr:hypothetical protein CDAR_231781 [Caerostris darwini]
MAPLNSTLVPEKKSDSDGQESTNNPGPRTRSKSVLGKRKRNFDLLPEELKHKKQATERDDDFQNRGGALLKFTDVLAGTPSAAAVKKKSDMISENQKECPKCSLIFEDSTLLTRHLKTHSFENTTCPICFVSLSSASSRDRHLLIHSGERPFGCTFCGLKFTTNGNMHRHMQGHIMRGHVNHKKKTRQRKDWRSSTESSKSPEQGEESTKQESSKFLEYIKKLGFLEFTFTHKLEEKLKEETTNTGETSSASRVINHESELMEDKNSKDDFFRFLELQPSKRGAEDKAVGVGNNSEEKEPTSTFHLSTGKDGNYNSESLTLAKSAAICNSGVAKENETSDILENSDQDFAKVSDIISNLESVPGAAAAVSDQMDVDAANKKSVEKPHACAECSYRSADKSTLKRHMAKHKKERPHLCNICEKTFTLKSNCERHIREKHDLHSREEIIENVVTRRENPDDPSEEPRKCKYCHHSFENEQALQHHLRSKSCKAKPFICKICNTGSSTKNNCFRHIEKMHPELFQSGLSNAEKNAIKIHYTIRTCYPSPTEDTQKNDSSENSMLETSNLATREIHFGEIQEPQESLNEDSRTVAAEALLSLVQNGREMNDEPLNLSVRNKSTQEPLAEDLSDEDLAVRDLSARPLDLSVRSTGYFKLGIRSNEEESQNLSAAPHSDSPSSTREENYFLDHCDLAPQHVGRLQEQIPKANVLPRSEPDAYPKDTATTYEHECELCEQTFSTKALKFNHIRSNHSVKERYLRYPPLPPNAPTDSRSRKRKALKNHNDNNETKQYEERSSKIQYDANNLYSRGANSSDMENEDLASIPSVISTANSTNFLLPGALGTTENSSINLMNFEGNKGETTTPNEKKGFPHRCSVCSQLFRWPSNLDRHVVKHTKVKAFECGRCNRTYTTSSNLRRHTLKKRCT